MSKGEREHLERLGREIRAHHGWDAVVREKDDGRLVLAVSGTARADEIVLNSGTFRWSSTGAPFGDVDYIAQAGVRVITILRTPPP